MHVLTTIFFTTFKVSLSILHIMTPTHEYNIHLYENSVHYLRLEKNERKNSTYWSSLFDNKLNF